jgi:hypothetical protein
LGADRRFWGQPGPSFSPTSSPKTHSHGFALSPRSVGGSPWKENDALMFADCAGPDRPLHSRFGGHLSKQVKVFHGSGELLAEHPGLHPGLVINPTSDIQALWDYPSSGGPRGSPNGWILTSKLAPKRWARRVSDRPVHRATRALSVRRAGRPTPLCSAPRRSQDPRSAQMSRLQRDSQASEEVAGNHLSPGCPELHRIASDCRGGC